MSENFCETEKDKEVWNFQGCMWQSDNCHKTHGATFALLCPWDSNHLLPSGGWQMNRLQMIFTGFLLFSVFISFCMPRAENSGSCFSWSNFDDATAMVVVLWLAINGEKWNSTWRAWPNAQWTQVALFLCIIAFHLETSCSFRWGMALRNPSKRLARKLSLTFALICQMQWRPPVKDWHYCP